MERGGISMPWMAVSGLIMMGWRFLIPAVFLFRMGGKIESPLLFYVVGVMVCCGWLVRG